MNKLSTFNQRFIHKKKLYYPPAEKLFSVSNESQKISFVDPAMADSLPPPYYSDGESRPPRKHRHDQRNGRSERHSENQDGYSYERRNQHEPSHNRPRGRDRYREDRGPSVPKEIPNQDQHYEERGPKRHKHERGGNGHRERDPRYEDRGPSRNQTERNRDHHHHNRDQHPSERSYNQYQGREVDHKERRHKEYDEREREYSKHSLDRQSYPAESKDPDRLYPSMRFPPNGSQVYDMEYSEETEGGILDCNKCRYLCTTRACCQLVEVLLNMLILICCSVSYNSTGGYTGIANMGGIYYYQFGGAYSGFSGADGEKAQKLDLQFYQLKLPTVTASMAFGGALMTFSFLMVLLGVLRVPWRWPVWLLVEFALDVAIAAGYIPALYFYFQRLNEAYNSQVCKDREELYKSKGYDGFSCALHGADIAAALFACMADIAFIMSAWLCIKGFRTVRSMRKKPAGILQMLEVILNALVLICIISSYFVLSGFSGGMASGGFGGGYYPFEGQELKEVRQLDQEFTLLRAPLLYGGLTVSLLMGTLTLAILASGSKPLLRLSNRWLIFEAAFGLVAFLGYGAAVGVYLHFALQINATDVCKRRERLYARNGLTWMNCDLSGTDGGAAAFGILLVILYGASVVLAIRAYKERRSLQQ
ncbi:MARVEL domain-containing protein 3 [Gastrophryne carolinensis]